MKTQDEIIAIIDENILGFNGILEDVLKASGIAVSERQKDNTRFALLVLNSLKQEIMEQKP